MFCLDSLRFGGTSAALAGFALVALTIAPPTGAPAENERIFVSTKAAAPHRDLVVFTATPEELRLTDFAPGMLTIPGGHHKALLAFLSKARRNDSIQVEIIGAADGLAVRSKGLLNLQLCQEARAVAALPVDPALADNRAVALARACAVICAIRGEIPSAVVRVGMPELGTRAAAPSARGITIRVWRTLE